MKYFFIIFLFCAPTCLFAYLDPGTGSLLLYAVVGSIASLVFAFRNLWYWCLERIFSGSFQTKAARLPDIVIHSEGGKYWLVFKPIVEALLAQNRAVAYVSPDKADPGLELYADTPLYVPLNPGKELATISFMNRISAKVVVSTTPNLDVYMWKRSRNVCRYVHVFHAPTGIDFYEKYSLSFYDDVLTVGPFQDAGIRYLDELRDLPRKKLWPVGCTYFDELIPEVASTHRANDTFTVLYAPSWGARSSLTRFGNGVLDALLSSGVSVIFRPHPQSSVSDAAVLAEALALCSGNPSVRIDRSRSNVQSLCDADVMVSDFSGVIADYRCLFGRPVILMDGEQSAAGYEAEDLGSFNWDIPSIRSESILCSHPGEIPSLIRSLQESPERYARSAPSPLKQSLYNFGGAGEQAANALIQILGECT